MSNIEKLFLSTNREDIIIALEILWSQDKLKPGNMKIPNILIGQSGNIYVGDYSCYINSSFKHITINIGYDRQ